MSSAKSPEMHSAEAVRKRPVSRSLAFRLTLWYGGILVLAMLVCVGAFYGLMVSSMRARSRSDLSRLADMLNQALAAKGLDEVQSRIDAETASLGDGDVFFRILDTQGRQVRASNLLPWRDVACLGELPGRLPPGREVFDSWTGSGHHAAVRVLTAPLGRDLTVQIGLTVTDDQLVIVELRRILGLVLLATTVVAVLVGWLMARRALAGMHGVTQTAQRISHGASLESRVSVTGRGDEVDELAQTVNGMLDRIEVLVEGMKETHEHLAHELRSPITRIRGQAELTLLSASSPADYQAMAAGTVEQCDRLLDLINTMLDISELEGRVGAPAAGEVDIALMVGDVCELFQPVAEDRRVKLDLRSAGPCLVRGDFQRLQRVLANLLDNAIKYSSEGGVVEVRVGPEDDSVVLSVRNPGPAIPPDELSRVFERFFRGGNSRGLPGNGLGLSLARAIVFAHGGTIAAQSSEAAGTTFTVKFPRSTASQTAPPKSS